MGVEEDSRSAACGLLFYLIIPFSHMHRKMIEKERTVLREFG